MPPVIQERLPNLRPLVVQHGRALILNLSLHESPTSLPLTLLLLAGHALGLLAVVRLTHRPLWLAWAVLLFLQPLLVSLRTRRWQLLLASFAPLILPYAVLALRLLVAALARTQGLTVGALTVPEPWGELLNLNAAMLLAGLWVLLAQVGPTVQTWGRPLQPLPLRQLAADHGQALALDAPLAEPPLRHTLLLLLLHGFGLAALLHYGAQPLWLPLAAVLGVQPLLASLRGRRLTLLPASLAPLFLVYALLAVRLLLTLVAHTRGLSAGWPLLPLAWAAWFDLDVALALAGLWVLLAQAGPTTEALERRIPWPGALGCALAVLALAWSAVTGWSMRTHGVTGSDPYCYAQMGVDVAERGTPLHVFDRAPQLAAWGLPLQAAVPVGYRAADPQSGQAATAWAPGLAVPLALAYRLAGEDGLYLLSPLLGLFSQVALGWLCLEALREWPVERRVLAAGVAVLVLATSYEHIERLLVPMADVAAQLLTTLTVVLALRAARQIPCSLAPLQPCLDERDTMQHTFAWAALAGLCLGAAFAVRYTQVLAALCIVVAVWPLRRTVGWRCLLASLAVAAAVAWLVALPVLLYHQAAFGAPLRTGSEELALFALSAVPKTFLQVGGELLRGNEFLYLAPLLVWGAGRLGRDACRPAVVLLAWLAAIVPFHLLYDALRLRDLLSVFPALALWVGVGAAALSTAGERLALPFRQLGRLAALALLTGLLWARSGATLRLPVPPMHFNTFGYLLVEQRAAFDHLAALLPEEAVVAASLNSGPIELYAARDAVRPEDWSTAQWLDFVDRALAAGWPLYLLDDGVAMREPLRVARTRHAMRPVAVLPLPYFYPAGGSANRAVLLYEVLP